MTSLISKSASQLQAEMSANLLSNTNINELSPGSKAKALLDMVAKLCSGTIQDVNFNIANSFLPTAQGQFLDVIGSAYGINRIVPDRTVLSESLVVRFYVEDGTFGDINSNNNIVIPKNTLITNSNGGTVFKTLKQETLLSTDSEKFITVQSNSPNRLGFIAKNSLNTHSFTSYTEGNQGTLKVDNEESISFQTQLESDNDYRTRIGNALKLLATGNEAAVTFAALTTPGVKQAIFRPFVRGIGTCDVVIEGITTNVPTGLIQMVQQKVNEVKPLGVDVLVRPVTQLGMSMSLELTYQPGTSRSERNVINQSVSSALISYINNIPVGDAFIFNEAIQRVLDVSDKIKNVGRTAQPFKLVTIHIPNELGASTQNLTDDFSLSPEEKLIVEPSLASPIVITELN